MFEISEAQIEALREQRVTEFAKHLAKRGRRLHAEACEAFSDDALLETMEGVIVAARKRGLRKTSELERFSDLSMTIGVGFEESEDWAVDAFGASDLKPVERLRNVEGTAVFMIREG